MRRGYVLSQDDLLRAIARGVVEERLPAGNWNVSVDIDGPAPRCVVVVTDGEPPMGRAVPINTWRKCDELQRRVDDLEDLRQRVRSEIRAVGVLLRDAPKRRPKRTPSA